jgi:hypothetical protein
MKQCAFTIVAKNYIGLGQILGESLHRHNPKVDFFIFVADEFEKQPNKLPEEVVIAKDVLVGISPNQWRNMAFKYDLTEFCTAIKPFCFEHVFSLGYEKTFYFDPDIYIFSSIQSISDALNDHTMTLTPQIVGIHPDYQGEHPEWAMNVNGIFNLGFCGIRNNDLGKQVVKWWEERMRDQAFADRSIGQFTDQKWMDWMPGFLGQQLYVQQSLGMNMAPWNYFERELLKDSDDQLFVSFRSNDMTQRHDPLVFVHFAGYDYKQLKKGIISRKRIEDLKEYNDLEPINNIYRDAIVTHAEVFDSFIEQAYSYSTYDNGVPIAAFHRRLYHGLNETTSNPFSTGSGTFYQLIKKKGMIIEEKIDHVSRRNMNDLDSKKKALSFFYRILYRLLGYKRYVMFLKSLYFYCRPEIHSFLIKR